MNIKGDGIPADKEKAAELYQKAAKQGNPKAQTNLGLMYAEGDGVEQNKNLAVKYFKKSAKNGDTDSMFLYRKMLGVICLFLSFYIFH